MVPGRSRALLGLAVQLLFDYANAVGLASAAREQERCFAFEVPRLVWFVCRASETQRGRGGGAESCALRRSDCDVRAAASLPDTPSREGAEPSRAEPSRAAGSARTAAASRYAILPALSFPRPREGPAGSERCPPTAVPGPARLGAPPTAVIDGESSGPAERPPPLPAGADPHLLPTEPPRRRVPSR